MKGRVDGLTKLDGNVRPNRDFGTAREIDGSRWARFTIVAVLIVITFGGVCLDRRRDPARKKSDLT